MRDPLALRWRQFHRNSSRYHLQDFGQTWNSQKHPILHSHGQALGCVFLVFRRKLINWPWQNGLYSSKSALLLIALSFVDVAHLMTSFGHYETRIYNKSSSKLWYFHDWNNSVIQLQPSQWWDSIRSWSDFSQQQWEWKYITWKHLSKSVKLLWYRKLNVNEQWQFWHWFK